MIDFVAILLELRHYSNVKVTPKDGGRGGFMGRGRGRGGGYGFSPYGGSFPGYGGAYPPTAYPTVGYVDPYAYGSYFNKTYLAHSRQACSPLIQLFFGFAYE